MMCTWRFVMPCARQCLYSSRHPAFRTRTLCRMPWLRAVPCAAAKVLPRKHGLWGCNNVPLKAKLTSLKQQRNCWRTADYHWFHMKNEKGGGSFGRVDEWFVSTRGPFDSWIVGWNMHTSRSPHDRFAKAIEFEGCFSQNFRSVKTSWHILIDLEKMVHIVYQRTQKFMWFIDVYRV